MKSALNGFFSLLIIVAGGAATWYNWSTISTWASDNIVLPGQCKTTPWTFKSDDENLVIGLIRTEISYEKGYWQGRYAYKLLHSINLDAALQSLRTGATDLTIADDAIEVKTGRVQYKEALTGLYPACATLTLDIRFYIEGTTQSFGGPSREWFFSTALQGDTAQVGYAQNLRTHDEYCFTFVGLKHETPTEGKSTFVEVDIKDLVPCNKK